MVFCMSGKHLLFMGLPRKPLPVIFFGVMGGIKNYRVGGTKIRFQRLEGGLLTFIANSFCFD